VIKSENLTFPMYMFLSEIIAMADIDAKIKAQGDKIRELKSAKTGKDIIDFFVYQVMPIVCPRKKSICK